MGVKGPALARAAHPHAGASAPARAPCEGDGGLPPAREVASGLYRRARVGWNPAGVKILATASWVGFALRRGRSGRRKMKLDFYTRGREAAEMFPI